ncbi:hypothetical protein [Bosea sp. MMO-172]|uniref:hypothetical protein n=1 Tax=Bosea sp. MMO-172 TaxID=3127885 RepID=UPI00301A9D33
MTQDTEFTPVMFRATITKGDREVTAVFPLEDGDGTRNPGSYAHVGQHGECSWGWVLSCTRPAKPEEYADLKRELEAEPYGYRLKVIKRRPRR